MEATAMALNLNIFTLNCWGIPFVSKNRNERMQAIAKYLSDGKHNIVCLQEVWSEDDFISIRNKIKDVLPYSHYFYSGVLGSGLCVFSKWPIADVFFHQWSLNGYIHKVHHGDWFGGKGVGLCRIRCDNWSINVYCTHLHAEYHEDDMYLAHRALQAYSTAELVRLTAAPAHLSLLVGDLNTQPGSLSYRLIKEIPSLVDPCDPSRDSLKGSGTSDNACNSYSDQAQIRKLPEGKRIDHIMFLAGRGIKVEPLTFENPLPDRVPDRPFSYSDHNAVSFQCKVSRQASGTPSQAVLSSSNTLREAIQVCQEAKQVLNRSRKAYLLCGAILFLLLLSTVGVWRHSMVQDLVRIAVTGLCFYCVIMGTIWYRMELNSLKAGATALENLLKYSGPTTEDKEPDTTETVYA